MNDFLMEFITPVCIPGDGKNFSEENRYLFDFTKNRMQFTTNRTSWLLALLILSFAFFLVTRNNEDFNLAACCLVILIAMVYAYDLRGAKVFKYASAAASRNHYKKAVRFIMFLVNSKRIYPKEMPSVYYILKSRDLMLSGDFASAEYLIDKTLKKFPKCDEALYIKSLCLIKKNEYEEASVYSEKIKKNIYQKLSGDIKTYMEKQKNS